MRVLCIMLYCVVLYCAVLFCFYFAERTKAVSWFVVDLYVEVCRREKGYLELEGKRARGVDI